MSNEILPKIMLVDMNSFFASVEQQANPFLRGKPVGVVASMHETSTLIASSKEAKALGISTGTLIYKAKKICPQIKLLPAEPEKYREVNRQINKIFLEYTNLIETYSIDESFLDLRQSRISSLLVGSEIKYRIRQEVGEWLTCSVGIGQNKFLAKLAADMQKPDGLTWIWRSQLPEIYKQKKLSGLWGIGRGWTKRLEKMGITSPLQLLNYPVQNLISIFGKPGFFIWERVNGLEKDEVKSSEDSPKSFGNSWVLNFRTTNKELLKPVILRLAEKAARRMRRKGFMASGFYLYIRLVDGRVLHKSEKLQFRLETGFQLYQRALKIWDLWDFSCDVMHIAVGFTRLSPKIIQLPLFVEKSEELTQTLDAINNKYGEFTIRSGLLTSTTDWAPDAIAFGK